MVESLCVLHKQIKGGGGGFKMAAYSLTMEGLGGQHLTESAYVLIECSPLLNPITVPPPSTALTCYLCTVPKLLKRRCASGWVPFTSICPIVMVEKAVVHHHADIPKFLSYSQWLL